MNKSNPTKRQSNNHARTKGKRKLLRLKNFFKRVIDKRLEKKHNSLKPKGKTIVGKASVQIPFITRYQSSYYLKAGSMNQRQRRKRNRQIQNFN